MADSPPLVITDKSGGAHPVSNTTFSGPAYMTDNNGNVIITRPDPATIPPPTDDPKPQVGDVVVVPNAPKGGGSGGGGDKRTVVPSDMRIVAENLKKLVEDGGPLDKLMDRLNQVNVKPGGFPTARVLEKQIDGGDGLTAALIALLPNVKRACANCADKLLLVANGAENDEDLNKMTAEQYMRSFGTVSGDVTAVENSKGGGS